jgi:hypothetical protein
MAIVFIITCVPSRIFNGSQPKKRDTADGQHKKYHHGDADDRRIGNNNSHRYARIILGTGSVYKFFGCAKEQIGHENPYRVRINSD